VLDQDAARLAEDPGVHELIHFLIALLADLVAALLLRRRRR
jgi:hypothetical protein